MIGTDETSIEIPTGFCTTCNHDAIVYQAGDNMLACIHCNSPLQLCPLKGQSIDTLTHRGYQFYNPFGDDVEGRIRSGGCGGDCGGDGGCKSCSKKSDCHPTERKERLLPRLSKSLLTVMPSTKNQ